MALPIGERNTSVSQTSTLKWMEEFSLYDSETEQFMRFFGTCFPPDLSAAEDSEIEIVVTDVNERLDKLANKYLKDPNLWWVLAQYNNIDSPEYELYLGMHLFLPTQQWVQDNIVNRPQAQRKAF